MKREETIRKVLIVGGNKNSRDLKAEELHEFVQTRVREKCGKECKFIDYSCYSLKGEEGFKGLLGEIRRDVLCYSGALADPWDVPGVVSQRAKWIDYDSINTLNGQIKSIFFDAVNPHVRKHFYIVVLHDAQTELYKSAWEEIVGGFYEVTNDYGGVAFFVVTTESQENLSKYFKDCFDSIINLDSSKVEKGEKETQKEKASAPLSRTTVTGKKKETVRLKLIVRDKEKFIGRKKTVIDRQVWFDGKPYNDLPDKPFKFLYALTRKLSRNPKEHVTTDVLYGLITDRGGERSEKAISNHMRTIVKRIPPLEPFIDNKRRAGYRLTLSPEAIQIEGVLEDVDDLLRS